MSDQSASVKWFLLFIPVKTEAIEDVITIFFTLLRKAAKNTVSVPSTAGLMISSSCLGFYAGKGDAR